MPEATLIRNLLLPEVRLIKTVSVTAQRRLEVHAAKAPREEYCPKCATRSESAYDHRTVVIKDTPLRGAQVRLLIRKRRLWCKPCGRPFTESVPGIRKGFRHTERYGRAILRSCERYSDLKQVRRDFRCSAGFLYTTLYRHLELERKKRLYPWPKVIGIDEHFFGRNKRFGHRDFVTMIVNHSRKSLMEVVDGRRCADLEASLAHIEGRENVRWATIDMCDPYKQFVQRFFPNARLVADKFHVLRLLHPAINRHRKLITGDKRSLPVRRLLLRSGINLEPWLRNALGRWLDQHPALRELYSFKEALHRLYRTRGHDRAYRAFTHLTDQMARSTLAEIQTLRRTLIRWRKPILAYFLCGITNARTEGFNLKAKLVKRKAFGYRSFRNYRLRLLNSCAR